MRRKLFDLFFGGANAVSAPVSAAKPDCPQTTPEARLLAGRAAPA